MSEARRPRAILRWKLVAALVAVSGLSLLAAVVAFVPQLDHRLTQDRLIALRQSARSEAASLDELSSQELRPGSPELVRLLRDLERRTQARAALYDDRGRVLADTDPDLTAPGTALLQQQRDMGLARAGSRIAAIVDGQAVVVRQQRIHRRRYTLTLRKPLDDTKAAVAIVRGGLPLATAVALLIALIVGIALSFGLLRRLERLRQGARRLGEEGVDRPLVPDTSPDEVGQVARALEAMRARLSADEQARQAFLSTASHELRTPVASLQGTLELLEESLGGDAPDVADARARVASATRQSRQLAQLTTDLLDLSRLDSEIVLRSEPLELRELTTSVASEFEARATECGATLDVDGGARPVWALADAPAVARIVRILLDNALRYAGHGRLVVASGSDAGHVWVRVSDEGPGVDPLERERIFGRFERGQEGQTRPGFGLGLPIGRALAQRMGGDLLLLDVVPGAAFELQLPAAEGPGL